MEGLTIKPDEVGVSILKKMADGIDEGADNIIKQTDALLDNVMQYPALGPHVEAIKRLVMEIQQETKNTSTPARKVAEKLREKAKAYQDWIDDDLFGDPGN